MPRAQQHRLPPGRQPYDTLNGARVGAIAGLLISAPIAVLTGLAWLLIVGVIGGGALGYAYQRADQARASRTNDDD